MNTIPETTLLALAEHGEIANAVEPHHVLQIAWGGRSLGHGSDQGPSRSRARTVRLARFEVGPLEPLMSSVCRRPTFVPSNAGGYRAPSDRPVRPDVFRTFTSCMVQCMGAVLKDLTCAGSEGPIRRPFDRSMAYRRAPRRFEIDRSSTFLLSHGGRVFVHAARRAASVPRPSIAAPLLGQPTALHCDRTPRVRFEAIS